MVKHLLIVSLLVSLGLLTACHKHQLAKDTEVTAIAPPVPEAKCWSKFPSDTFEIFSGINERYMWTMGNDQLVCYDMYTHDRTVFDEADGLPSRNIWGIRRLVVSADNQAAVLYNETEGLFHYQPDTGWMQIEVPIENKFYPQDICFTPNNDLVIFASDARDSYQTAKTFKLYQYTNNKLTPLRDLPLTHIGGLIPVDDGYLTFTYDKATKKHTPIFIPSDPNKPIEEREPVRMPPNREGYVQINGQVLLTTLSYLKANDPHSPYVLNAIRTVSSQGIDMSEPGSPLMLDITQNKLVPITIKESEGKLQWHIPVDQGRVTAILDVNGGCLPVRAINGDIHTSSQIWSNGEVHDRTDVVEPYLFYCTDPAQAWYDPKQGRWRNRVPEAFNSPHAVTRVVDIDRMLAWTMSDWESDTMSLVDLSQQEPRAIKTVKRERMWGLPAFKDTKGGWWITGRNYLVYLRPDGVQQPVKNGLDAFAAMSPRSGRVWLPPNNHFYNYYDDELQRFVLSDADTFHEDFSQQVGKLKISLFPAMEDRRYRHAWTKLNGVWRPLFMGGTHDMNICYDVWGDRLLLSGNDVWEYDCTNDRLIRLKAGFNRAFLMSKAEEYWSTHLRSSCTKVIHLKIKDMSLT